MSKSCCINCGKTVDSGYRFCSVTCERTWWRRANFKQEGFMITFNSQEEFEEAVMKVLAKRLRINIHSSYNHGDYIENLEVFLVDQTNESMYYIIDSNNTSIRS